MKYVICKQNNVPIRQSPTNMAPVIKTVPKGFKAKLLNEIANLGYLAIQDPEDSSTGYVLSSYVIIQEVVESAPLDGMNNLQSFIQYLKAQVGKPYVYGTAGETLTQDTLNRLIKTYGESFYKNARNYVGKQTFDCSGLIYWCAKKAGLNVSRTSAHYLFHNQCIEISKSQLQPGDLLFRQGNSKITHVAAYIGNNQIVEARGQDYNPNGVQQRAVPDTFQKFGRLKAIATGVTANFSADSIPAVEIVSDIPTSYTVTSTYEASVAPKNARDKVKALNGNLLLYYNDCVLYAVEVKSSDKKNNCLVIKWAPLHDAPINLDLEYEIYVY